MSVSACHSTWRADPSSVVVVLNENEAAPVRLAAEILCSDFEKVTGVKPDICCERKEGMVNIVIINRADSLGDQTDIPLDGFESHAVSSDQNTKTIYLEGYDMRGTIYAIYSFDEKVLGVPPLWYWASWTPEQKKMLEIPEDMVFDSPDVQYRSWLANDSDLWSSWIRKSEANNEAVYETMLRLKLNTLECGGLGYPGITPAMHLCAKYGLVVTSHHMYMLNTSFSNWGRYWKKVKACKNVPALSIKDTSRLQEFWEYGAKSVTESGVENIWNISFRGSGDQPFWVLFKDAPETEEERAAVINDMLRRQVRIIKKYSQEEKPVIRMTFYDEMADLVTRGLVIPPSDENMIWTFCSGRRDHYPYDDIQQFSPETPVKLAYYMNLQFTSTGAHLAPAEGPWKMEFNYRYLNSKMPLYLSVVNSGNFREFLFTMTGNAKMLWDMDTYSTDSWVEDYCRQYFGSRYAKEIASLYKEYFYSFWTQKKPDFPGGMERQFIFQDQRYSRAIHYLKGSFFSGNMNPLPDRFGYERVPGRVFRVTPEDCGADNQIEAIIKGMDSSRKSFAEVSRKASLLMNKLPKDKQQFFYDNLLCYALFMQHLSETLWHFTSAYQKHDNANEALVELDAAYLEMVEARKALLDSQTGVFEDWYATDQKFDMEGVLSNIDKVRKAITESKEK